MGPVNGAGAGIGAVAGSVGATVGCATGAGVGDGVGTGSGVATVGAPPGCIPCGRWIGALPVVLEVVLVANSGALAPGKVGGAADAAEPAPSHMLTATIAVPTVRGMLV